MDSKECRSKKNPRDGANIFSIITYTWLFPIFLTGYKRKLEMSDLYLPLEEHSSRFLGDKISRLWDQELERCKTLKKTPSLVKVLVRCFGCNVIALSLCITILELVVKVMRPIMLSNLLRYFRGDHAMERMEAYCWGTAIVFGLFLEAFMFKLSTAELQHVGMKMRVACCSLIYRKILKVSKPGIGKAINLLSNDVGNFDFGIFSMPYMWIAPFQTILISYLLYMELGLAGFGGIAIMLLFIVVNGLTAELTSYLRSIIARRTDERLRLTNQIISAVKIIKMYAWEKPFANLNDNAREKEMKIIRINSTIEGVCLATKDFIPKVCIFVTVLVYIWRGSNIDAEKFYLVTAYYGLLRFSICSAFVRAVRENASVLVSIKRLKEYLLLEEISQQSVTHNSKTPSQIRNDNISVSFNNVCAKWNSESKFQVLKQISFQLRSHSLTAVIGQIGAGKTSLFRTMLQEIPDIQGELKINGTISYASQEPWLFNSSIKQNILFGKPFDKKRYEKVIEVCQLKRDYELLPYGDNTLIGEKGINLSGGQCARVNLARAVYHEADIYLLDDPLSAVDTQVGKGIFEDCIKHFLKDKTVVLITHQFHYLKDVDRIIVLDNGTILGDGTYANLVNSSLKKILHLGSETHEKSNSKKMSTNVEEVKTEEIIASKVEKEKSESSADGGVTMKTYLQYFKAAQNCFAVFLVFLISIICQIFISGNDYFIARWIDAEELGINFTSLNSDDHLRGRSWYIQVYGVLTILIILFVALQSCSYNYVCTKISRNLYNMMLTSVMKSKMSFFNANPIGRIMNRFSKDIGLIDNRLPGTIIDVANISLSTFAALSIIPYVNLWFLIGTIVFVAIGYFFRLFYMKTNRTIRRLEGITRSPIFNHLTDSIHGLTTIRTLKAQQIVINDFDSYQDAHSSTWFLFSCAGFAFSMYIDFLCAIFSGMIIYTLLSSTSIALAGDAGFAISQSLLMTGMVQWVMRQSTELENQMISVERVLEYTKLEQEPSLERTSENKSPERWPQQGQLLFQDVSLLYDCQEKSAIRNLNFTLNPGEMIGIVGRTGAGKSSIVNALFRLADTKGNIYIDNVDTSKIALQDLRSKISIIPQEPVLFEGTLRTNLDPFEEYPDNVLWQALEEVAMKVFLQSDLGLDMRVTDDGTNFSTGQKQLLCLARAIIRSNKLLVLDEATANVDPQTDELIQKAIRKKFANCTVLIIAHRLNTVMDASKILVMEAGTIVEFDHPYILLQQKGGFFYNMAQQAGSATFENLFQIAKLNYENSSTIQTRL